MNQLNLLGLKCKDKVTGFTGIITSISFDLFGCIQVVITPEKDKEGKLKDSHWFDTNRIEIIDKKPVMEIPTFKTFADFPKKDILKHNKGAQEKPIK